jgi:hypothetical protein
MSGGILSRHHFGAPIEFPAMVSKLDAATLRERLHDGLCQQLTGALMFSRVLSDALKKRNDPLANDAETLFQMINDAADEVHSLMNEAGKKDA